MQPTFMNIPENLCKCGHSLIEHNVKCAEGAPLLCDQCDCGYFFTENGRLRICDFPFLVELKLLEAGVVYINGVAFAVEAFEYLANPSPVICVMERKDEAIHIRPLPALHDALVEYARQDNAAWMHTEIENTIMTEAQKLGPAKQLEDFITLEREQ